MKAKVEIAPPHMPNFAKVDIKAATGQKKDEGTWIDVGNFSEEEAIEFAELMKKTFMEHWDRRRKELQ